jgi:catechol-2,3-dioxygenase
MALQTELSSASRAPDSPSPRRLAHANLFVSNLETSMRFYNKVAGFEEVCRLTTGAGFLSNGNGLQLVEVAIVVVADDERMIAAEHTCDLGPSGRGGGQRQQRNGESAARTA